MFFHSLAAAHIPLVSFPMGPMRGCHLHGSDVINSPALAIDKRPGPVCLSLLEPNEGARNAVGKVGLTSSRRGNDHRR